MKNVFVVLCVLMSVSVFAFDPKGIWLTESGSAKVQIWEQGGKLWGKIVWLKNPIRQGKPLVDAKNPDEKRRQMPILGLVIVSGLVPQGSDEYDGGQIYDPESGKTYSLEMEQTEHTKLKLRGYMGVSLLGRSQVWTRSSL